MKTKECNKCNKVKSLSNFYPHSQTKDGLYGACGECRKEWQRDYQKRNNDKIVQSHDHYRKTKLKGGIYTITNNITGKVYIGESTMLRRRLRRHQNNLKNLKHENSTLQEDYVKYGDVFTYDVVEEFPPGTSKLTLRQKEALLIADYLREGKEIYNLGENKQ